MILDITDIQSRATNPQPRLVSTLFWEDGGVARRDHPRYSIKGKPYIIFTERRAPVRCRALRRPRGGVRARAAPFGFARIIDISDETRPTTVSKLTLEPNDPANCDKYLNDFPPETTNNDTYGYSSHYCTPDATKDPKMLACSYWGAGSPRVRHPRSVPAKEIAMTTSLPHTGRSSSPDPLSGTTTPGKDRTTDRVGSNIRFNTVGAETHLWFIGQDNGFQVAKFTRPMSELLR